MWNKLPHYPDPKRKVLIYRQDYDEYLIAHYLGENKWTPTPFVLNSETITQWAYLDELISHSTSQ